ncbi:Hypothetical_protein [Hexamita inflata]|uniref:Hypothetical_protein n=1 Tax=Hexamita inflata TaxID=28002 RepID=A0AA86QGA6_9EUKA|nr:Hypothetical protein HINF_LOCUS43826 [Hexamita inflata]
MIFQFAQITRKSKNQIQKYLHAYLVSLLIVIDYARRYNTIILSQKILPLLFFRNPAFETHLKLFCVKFEFIKQTSDIHFSDVSCRNKFSRASVILVEAMTGNKIKRSDPQIRQGVVRLCNLIYLLLQVISQIILFEPSQNFSENRVYSDLQILQEI